MRAEEGWVRGGSVKNSRSTRGRVGWWSVEREGLSLVSRGLACLTCLAPLLVGGAPAWSLTILSVGASLLVLSLSVHSQRCFSLFGLWSVGYLISLMGVGLTLLPIPLAWVELLSPHAAKRWAEMSSLLGQTLNVRLSLTPVESLSWFTLELSCLFVAYVAYHMHRERRAPLSVLALLGPLLTLIGLAHQLLGARQLFGLYQSYDRERHEGFLTTIINDNSAASVMTLSALTALGLLLYELRGSVRVNVRARVWLSSVLLSVLGVVLCASRGALIALTLGVVVLVWFAWRRSERTRVWRGLSFVIGLSLLGAFWSQAESWLQLIALQPVQSSHLAEVHSYPRWLTWRDSLPYLRDYLWWGSGRGSFGEVFMSYQTFPTSLWVSSAESHPLLQALEGGLIGVVGSCVVPFLAWLMWWRRSRGEAHEVALGLWVGLGAVSVHQFADFGFEYGGLSIPVAVAWGLLWSYLPASSQTPRGWRRRWWARGGLSLLVLWCVGVGVIVSHHNTAWLRLRAVSADVKTTHQRSHRVSLLREALKVHPVSAHLSTSMSLELFKELESLETGVIDRGDLQAEEERARELERWLVMSRRLGPQQEVPYVLEARRLRASGLKELATLSYHRAVQLAPWRFSPLAQEMILKKTWSMGLFKPIQRAPFVRALLAQSDLVVLVEQLLSVELFEGLGSSGLDQQAKREVTSALIARCDKAFMREVNLEMKACDRLMRHLKSVVDAELSSRERIDTLMRLSVALQAGLMPLQEQRTSIAASRARIAYISQVRSELTTLAASLESSLSHHSPQLHRKTARLLTLVKRRLVYSERFMRALEDAE